MQQDYLTPYLPEKGYFYFVDQAMDKSGRINDKHKVFSLWSGYFSDIAEAVYELYRDPVSQVYRCDEMPIEFKMSFLAQDFDDNPQGAIGIDVQATISTLLKLREQPFHFPDSKQCLTDLIAFLTCHATSSLFISED